MKNISVIIPVYNAEKFIEKTVNSALQFDEVSEVILVEDASPDNALEVCENLEKANVRVKLYQHPNGENRGAGASRNLGLEKATGDFIAFLDADDFYLPNRFDADEELFKNEDVDAVSNAVGIHYDSEKAKQQYFSIYGNKMDRINEESDPEDVFPGQMWLRGSFGMIHLDGLTIRKSAFEKTNVSFNANLRLHQDTEFTMKLSYYLNIYTGIIDQPVAMRVIHESNRITQVDSKKVKPSKSRVLLWESMNDWAIQEKTMPVEYQKHITRLAKSYGIANRSFPSNYIAFISSFLTDFPIVKNGIYNIQYRNELFPFLKKLL